MTLRSIALATAIAFTSTALGDEPASAPVAPPEPSVAAITDQAAVVESAQLDTAAVESGAASDALGMSPGVTAGLVFIVIAVATFIVMSDGTPEGVGASKPTN